MQEQQQANGSGDDFQEVGYSGALKGKFTMDNALEDKICDLYDLYVEVRIFSCVRGSHL